MSRSWLLGRATKAGTAQFLQGNNLIVQLKAPDLSISPIIHGPPKYILSPHSADLNIETAVMRNRSNAVYVYNKNPSKDICWSSAILKHLVATYSSSTGLSRENLVAIAGLGNAGDDLLYKDLMGEIERVRECTQLEHIEVAILTIDSESLRHPDRMKRNVEALSALCNDEGGPLSSFGLHIHLPPYKYHTPRPHSTPSSSLSSSDYELLPGLIESSVGDNINCSLILYNISPSHQLPATYPLLDHETKYQWAADDEIPRESKFFIRASFDPLTCYHGLGTGEDLDASAEMEALEENNDNPIDNDMMKVPVDADDGTDAGSKTETESRNIYTFDVPGLNKKPIHRDPQLNEEELHQPLVLISSAHSPQFEHSISLALDDLCPPLESSSFLEEKAIRIALSVGTSAVVLESNQSARIARLALQKRLLLTAEDTEDVFGNFKVPFSATA